ncbi:MAG: hypothetical protein Q6358_04265 [Candidatus Brocadiales bacterium]|nr:hypothetical protein [Candidatus Brocadiales bacterium]
MSKIEELNAAIQELNRKLEELQMVFNGYKAFIARVSKNMHESLGTFLDKTQSVVEMAYGNDKSNFTTLEKISNEILEEINKLILLKGELWSLSCFKVGDDHPFPPLPKMTTEDEFRRDKAGKARN